MNMLHLVLLVSGFGLIALYDVPQMTGKQQWRELTVFVFVLLTGFSISLLLFMKVNVPNPMKFIEALVRYLMELTSSLAD